MIPSFLFIYQRRNHIHREENSPNPAFLSALPGYSFSLTPVHSGPHLTSYRNQSVRRHLLDGPIEVKRMVCFLTVSTKLIINKVALDKK